jgi:hypothetical protein
MQLKNIMFFEGCQNSFFFFKKKGEKNDKGNKKPIFIKKNAEIL